MAPQPEMQRGDARRSRVTAQLLSEFSARAGHDLIGPVNQASSLLALFIHQQKSGPQSEAHVLLDHLQSAASRMHVAVAAVQQFLSVAADTRDFGAVDLNTALVTAQQKMDREIAESGAVVSHDTLPVITANGDQMTLLFEILISNAIRFRRPEAPPLVRISARESGDDWELTVTDNGIGIDAEYREMVFQPFRRLHGREYPGAGLGLTTAKMIAGLHGGEIRIEPAAEPAGEAGTAVVISVPRVQSGQ